MSSATEERIHQFLLNPRHYSDHPEDIDYRETHISRVYLSRHYVYKLKKNLSLDFIDYGSLEARRQACEAEITLNRRLAGDVYVRTCPLYQKPSGEITWDESQADGGPVEWIVQMQRLPDEKMLDHMLAAGEMPSDEQIETLCQRLRTFYQEHRYSSFDQSQWHTQEIKHAMDNFADLKSLIPESRDLILTIEARQRDFLLLDQERLKRRAACGYICDGHGDLKPEHICFIDPPVVYDCIEFDQNYRLNDVLDELSFLALECEFLGYPDLGERLLQKTLEPGAYDQTCDYFYRSYRACVRTKVEALKLQNATDDDKRLAHQRAIDRYISLGLHYALKINPPRLIAVGGLMGSGKTTLAQQLTETLAAEHIESDRTRQQLFDQPNHDSPKAFGKGRYSDANKQKVYATMYEQTNALLQEGRTVIFDASLIKEATREDLRKIASKAGATFHQLWCECPPELAQSRIRQRDEQGYSPSEARPELYTKQAETFERWQDEEAPLTIPTDGTPEDALAKALASIRQQPLQPIEDNSLPG